MRLTRKMYGEPYRPLGRMEASGGIWVQLCTEDVLLNGAVLHNCNRRRLLPPAVPTQMLSWARGMFTVARKPPCVGVSRQYPAAWVRAMARVKLHP